MRIIDADRAKEIAEVSLGDILLQTALKLLIDKVPTIDAVPVVQCKDCEHWNQAKMISPYQCVCEKFTNAPYIYNYRSRNDFCSYGERKDND